MLPHACHPEDGACDQSLRVLPLWAEAPPEAATAFGDYFQLMTLSKAQHMAGAVGLSPYNII